MLCVGVICTALSSHWGARPLLTPALPQTVPSTLVVPSQGMSAHFSSSLWACNAPLSKSWYSHLIGPLLSQLHSGVTEVLVAWEEEALSGSLLNLPGLVVSSKHTLAVTLQ